MPLARPGALLALALLAACGGDKGGTAATPTQKISIASTGDARADAATYLKQLCPKPIGGELSFMVWEGYTDTLFTKPFEDACGVKVTATYMGSSDDLVAKLDAQGNHVWSKGFEDSLYCNVTKVAVDPAGNVLVTGELGTAMDFGGGPLVSAGDKDAFAVRFDASGNHLWSKRFGAGGNQYASGAAVDGLGAVLLGGYFEQTIDLGTGPLVSGGGLDMFVGKLSP